MVMLYAFIIAVAFGFRIPVMIASVASRLSHGVVRP